MQLHCTRFRVNQHIIVYTNSLKYPLWCPILYLVSVPDILFNVYIENASLNERWQICSMILPFLMTKFGINVLFNINKSVTHHIIMLLLPYMYQLSNITCQLKDMYGLGCGQLVEMTVVLTSPEGIRILCRSGIFAIDTYIVNFQTCPRHRDELGVYQKRQKRTCQSPPHPAKSSVKCSRGKQASICKDFWQKSRTFLAVGAGKNHINC